VGDDIGTTGGRPAERQAAETPATTARPVDIWAGTPTGDELLEAEPEYDPWAVPDGPSRTPTQEQFERGIEELKDDVMDLLKDVDEAVPGLFPRPAPLVSQADVTQPEEFASYEEPADTFTSVAYEEAPAVAEDDWGSSDLDV
jgi:hypothetical protein